MATDKPQDTAKAPNTVPDVTLKTSNTANTRDAAANAAAIAVNAADIDTLEV